MHTVQFSWLWSLLLTPIAAGLDYGTFQSPSNDARMKFRYWLPDASVDIATVQSDINAAGSLGAGGIEFLPLYNYGGSLAGQPEGADWATYGFGTPAFIKVFKASLQAVKEAGMLMDFAIGPNQGQGVPSETTDAGLHWDLAPFNVSVPANGSYHGLIPGWNSGELVALVSAEVISSSIVQNPSSSMLGTPATNSTRLVLKSDSLKDHTSKVQSDGSVALNFNTTSEAKHHLFAYYQYQDLAKVLDIESNTTGTIFDNGSYTVDHFSSRGAQTVINFWETHILNDPEIKSLLNEVGKYGWEDSLEIKSNISWTPSIPDTVKELYGYDIRKYLPLVMYKNNNIGVQPSNPGDLECVLDTETAGAGYIHDFRAALTKGYGDYLKTLTSWMQDLGLEFSAQVSYNLPLDMEANVNHVDAPECESLAFNDNIDGYRQFSGVANVAQRKVISNEMGANLDKSFALPISQLLDQIKNAFVGGVNQIVLHGQTYTGNYYGTTWPGYIAFFLLFSESYMDKQPAWLHGYPDAIGYINRNQYVLHQGQPRTDVAFYNKASATDPYLGTVYTGEDLIDAGYTYTYISPENFNIPDAYVANKLLAPEGPAYRAIVVLGDQNVTLDAVKRLQEYADAGLPIILTNDGPQCHLTGSASTRDAVTTALEGLRKSKNTYSTRTGGIAEKLKHIGLHPRVEVVTNGTWYPVFRTRNSTDFVFIASAGIASTGYITVQTSKTPYIFNSWTGEQAPLLQYQRKNDSLVISLSLAGNQTTILAFSNTLASEIDTPATHATNVPANVLGYNYTSTRGLSLHVAAASSRNQSIKLSNGNMHAISTNATLSALPLKEWTLTAEHWEAPANISDATIVASKRNTTHHLTTLSSWPDIPGLQNASGLGYYSTNFTWSLPKSGNSNLADGAYISFPEVSHGLRVYVNGHLLPVLDFFKPQADISSYLVDGQNDVTAVVPTIMWNYIRSIFDELKISGTSPMLSSPLPSAVDTGLIGDVEIIPYTRHLISI